MMSKTANVSARVEPELKERAESILASLGIPASSAITMFYKQVIFQGGLPFEMKLPANPLDITAMSKEELYTKLSDGIESAQQGKTMQIDEFDSEFRKAHNI
ncbi:MAG: type II toxin-antitoxin system RelB/DinJ family antitoxin [Eubacterium sp.]|nr:type II toxin-antitoxin system RelB/DinJ family antitoxin [Eubacterium sp.]MBR4242136.1 type II toxin-antitoxin system RelB/DinJ family antitoxin [Eubacterium sp.]MBR7061201.1 type II toxin-antitoxin system RelB/DinJ family antitoxin [Eubacterium sp.]